MKPSKDGKNMERIAKEMRQENYEVLYRNVTGIVQERAEASGRDLEMCNQRVVIHAVSSRLKTAESICKKLTKKGVAATLTAARQELADIFGVRIVVMYLDDVYQTASRLKQSAGLTLLYEKDYIRNPKRSGYRGLHLIFAVDVIHRGQVRQEKCEVQIRTMAMDSWAALEHQLIYKSPCAVHDIHEDLKNWSDELAKQDRKLVEFRKNISTKKNEKKHRKRKKK